MKFPDDFEEAYGLDETEEIVMGGDFDGSAYQDRRIVDVSFTEVARRLLQREGIFLERPRPAIQIKGTITGRIVRDGRPPIEEVERLRTRFPEMKETERQVKKLSRKEALERVMLKHAEMLAHLEQLPDEPKAPENSPFPPAVFFVKKFPDSEKEYAYTFFKAPHNGLWYGSGPKQAGYARSWDELMEWLEASGPLPVIYKLTGYEEYWTPDEDDN